LSLGHISSSPAEGASGPQVSEARGDWRDESERIVWIERPRNVTTPVGVVQECLDADSWASVRRWSGGLSVGVGSCRAPGGGVARARRGTVSGFTESSGRRLTRYLAECEANYRYMGTLTVGADFSADGADFKRAIDAFLVWFMRAQQRSAVARGSDPGLESVFWFAEFQARGAPHLHFFYTTRVQWQESARQWAAICGRSGLCASDLEKFARTSTRFETLRGGNRAARSYARKYARKQEQKQIPAGYNWTGRWWGVRGLRKRGSCHVVTVSGGPGFGRVLQLRVELNRAADAGFLRRFRWPEGDGEVFVPWRRGDGGPAGSWADLPELSARIERVLSWLIVQPDMVQRG
jgi:hypothetical protein